MKSLVEYIKEEVSCSLGDMMDKSNFATPGNIMGMGDVKPPQLKEPGSDVFGTTRKEKPKKKNKKEKND